MYCTVHSSQPARAQQHHQLPIIYIYIDIASLTNGEARRAGLGWAGLPCLLDPELFGRRKLIYTLLYNCKT